MDVWKKVPAQLRCCDGLFNVATIKAYPPGTHYHSPIKNNLFCVTCILSNGAIRHFGAANAKIGSDLRMHIVINSDEERSRWEDSNLEFLGLKARR